MLCCVAMQIDLTSRHRKNEVLVVVRKAEPAAAMPMGRKKKTPRTIDETMTSSSSGFKLASRCWIALVALLHKERERERERERFASRKDCEVVAWLAMGESPHRRIEI